MARTVVMIHPGGLGDVLLAVQAMSRLRTRFPKHRLVLCAEDQSAKLLIECRVIDAWAPAQGRDCADLFAGVESPTNQIQRWLETCDLAIGWMKDLDGTFCKALKTAGAQEAIVRSPFSATIRATHQRDRFLEAINEIPSGSQQDVSLRPAERLFNVGRVCLEAEGLVTGQFLVVIHPGSGSVHKCVSPGTLASLVRVVQDFGATPVLLEGPADHEPVERLLQLCVNRPTVLKGLDILRVAGVIAQAQLFVGQDSGVTHLAGLMGVRTVALFGPTEPDRWAPRGPHVSVVQGVPCLCQSWDAVSRCEAKPCLEIPQNYLEELCLSHLKVAAADRGSPAVSLPVSCH
ncbi:MAG: glycosyltransferase family 9 protein [Nitrospira sp. CG24E]|nr:MAG: glycosyltransferase family 9 protein [Nitrospira sp. CG24E]